jgi:hypothetical protein
MDIRLVLRDTYDWEVVSCAYQKSSGEVRNVLVFDFRFKLVFESFRTSSEDEVEDYYRI